MWYNVLHFEPSKHVKCRILPENMSILYSFILGREFHLLPLYKLYTHYSQLTIPHSTCIWALHPPDHHTLNSYMDVISSWPSHIWHTMDCILAWPFNVLSIEGHYTHLTIFAIPCVNLEYLWHLGERCSGPTTNSQLPEGQQQVLNTCIVTTHCSTVHNHFLSQQ